MSKGDKEDYPITLHSKGLSIDLLSVHPGMELTTYNSTGDSKILTVNDLNIGTVKNPMTGTLEVNIRLSLVDPLEEDNLEIN